jgi:putative inorganic carbon (hco3(-)) transporter
LIIKNMAMANKSIRPDNSFGDLCDWGIVFSLCALIFVLPASIAFLDSFAALAVFFYLLKKINRIGIDWPSKTPRLNFPGKILFVWKGFAPPVNFLNRPLQLLVLAVFISVLFSQYPAFSFIAFMGKFIKCVFLYFSFIEAFSDEKRIRIFLGFFLLSALITALNGTVQHCTGRDFIKGHLIGTENFVSTHRISSTFFGANGFGAYLLPVLGLVIHFLFTAIARKRSWILAGGLTLFLVLLLACLCWTYSRSSWIGYFSILFVMVFLDRRKIFYAVPIFLICAFIFLPSLNNIRHTHLIVEKDKAFQKGESVESVLNQGGSGRFVYWKKAIAIIRSSPVWGTGLNTYTRILKQDPGMKEWWYAHNCYLQMAAETGLIGLSCFLWMLFVLLRNGLYYCHQIKDIWPLTLLQGIISGLFGFFVQSFFDNTFYTVQLGVLMWMMFGLMVAVTRLNGDRK